MHIILLLWNYCTITVAKFLAMYMHSLIITIWYQEEDWAFSWQYIWKPDLFLPFLIFIIVLYIIINNSKESTHDAYVRLYYGGFTFYTRSLWMYSFLRSSLFCINPILKKTNVDKIIVEPLFNRHFGARAISRVYNNILLAISITKEVPLLQRK